MYDVKLTERAVRKVAAPSRRFGVKDIFFRNLTRMPQRKTNSNIFKTLNKNIYFCQSLTKFKLNCRWHFVECFHENIIFSEDIPIGDNYSLCLISVMIFKSLMLLFFCSSISIFFQLFRSQGRKWHTMPFMPYAYYIRANFQDIRNKLHTCDVIVLRRIVEMQEWSATRKLKICFRK